MVSEADVARWMVAEIVARRTYYLSDLEPDMLARFGTSWVDPRRTGRRSISRGVRRRFRAEHGGAISWDPLAACWTVRRPDLRTR